MLSSAATRTKYICLFCRSRLPSQASPAPRLRSAAAVRTFAAFGPDPSYPRSPAQRLRDRVSRTSADRDSSGPPKHRDPYRSKVTNNDDLNVPFAEGEPEPSDVSPSRTLSDILTNVADRHRKNLQYPSKPLESFARPLPLNASARWQGLGLRDVVANTVARAFPEISRPTYTQVRLLPPLARGNSVVVNDLPGTGKSFSIALWLLSLDRAIRGYVDGKPDISTTALVLVPNIDLALQYRSIMLHLLENTGSDAIRSNPNGFVQALYRSKEHEGEMLQTLKENPRPHIVIATPTILLDILSNEDVSIRNLIDYHSLKAIVIDEIDTAIARYDSDAVLAPETESSATEEGEKDKRDPAMILLDWVFKARKAHAVKAGKRPIQPQLVVSSSSMGRLRILRTLEKFHPTWFEANKRPGGFTLSNTSPASNVVLVNSRTKKEDKKIARLVSDTLEHCVVVYDLETGKMRDAPVPHYTDPIAGVEEFRAQEAKIVEDFEHALASKDDIAIAKLLARYQHASAANTRTGYPIDIAVSALENLLRHDGHPQSVMAAIGETVSQKAFIEECAKRGITARPLQFEPWNENSPIPLGRTDQSMTSQGSSSNGSEGPGTTVWVTNYYSCRGLDTPGITHGYILHRLHKVREYVTYCGRIARWPYTSSNEQLSDPRWLGRDSRPRGKVVAVVLEGQAMLEGVSMVRKDMSEASEWAWQMEAIRLVKVGVQARPYFEVPMEAIEAPEKEVEVPEEEVEIPKQEVEAQKEEGEIDEAVEPEPTGSVPSNGDDGREGR